MKFPQIERVIIKVIGHNTAFVDIRLPGVMLTGLKATRRHDGVVFLQPPVRTDQQGRSWPIYTLQPGIAEAAVEAVERQWSFATSRDGKAGF